MNIFIEFLKNFFTIFRSIYMNACNIFKKKETLLYPEISTYVFPRYRGRIILTRDLYGQERCVACNLCSVVCPVGCISLQKSLNKNNRWYPKFFRINFSRCIFCGLCEEACPTLAIQLSNDFELGEYKRKNLVYEKKDLLISGTGKYYDYNFYKISGVVIKNKKKEYGINELKPIDVKTLLP